jgi:hypothetical protein
VLGEIYFTGPGAMGLVFTDRVSGCRAAATSNSVRLREGWNGMVVSQTDSA